MSHIFVSFLCGMRRAELKPAADHNITWALVTMFAFRGHGLLRGGVRQDDVVVAGSVCNLHLGGRILSNAHMHWCSRQQAWGRVLLCEHTHAGSVQNKVLVARFITCQQQHKILKFFQHSSSLICD